MVLELSTHGFRTYISEPDRGDAIVDRSSRTPATPVYGNRRRIRGDRGKRLLRRRGERVERSFAHTYDTGGMRRTHLRGHHEYPQARAGPRQWLQSRARDAPTVGVGTPRGLQGRLAAVLMTALAVYRMLITTMTSLRRPFDGICRVRSTRRGLMRTQSCLQKRDLYHGLLVSCNSGS